MRRTLSAIVCLLFWATVIIAQTVESDEKNLASGNQTSRPAVKAEVPIVERAWVATQIFTFVRTNFGHWRAIPEFDLDHAFHEYLAQALVIADRREFDLLTMAFIAQLKNGHSGFGDKWLRDNFGQRLGFFAVPIDGKWAVTRTETPALSVGDVIVRLNDQPMELLYRRLRKYLSASDERWAQRSLFENPYLFPQEFDLGLEDGRRVHVVRKGEFQWAGNEFTEITTRNDGGVLYVRIPSFRSPSFEEAAVEAVRNHSGAKALILDLRGNHGGSTPVQLVATLMNQPYSYYAESTPLRIPLFRYRGELGKNAEIYWYAETENPNPDAYKGPIYLLIDGGCFSACEDFLVPFKMTKRGTLIGETTAGSSGQPVGASLWDGMSLGLSAKREYLPDGRDFEGIGIAPDIVVRTTLQDLRSGHDPVLTKARELLAGGGVR